jgi:hypothetical protein
MGRITSARSADAANEDCLLFPSSSAFAVQSLFDIMTVKRTSFVGKGKHATVLQTRHARIIVLVTRMRMVLKASRVGRFSACLTVSPGIIYTCHRMCIT